MDAIVVEGLTKRFNGFTAVDHINFTVKKGIIYGFLGPNGAGKTTTLRMLSTVLKPTSGTAKILGYDIVKQKEKVREVIGLVPEETGVYDRLTPVENLLFYGKIRGLQEGKLRDRIKDLLERLSLWEKRNELAGKLSKGMKRKLAFARAIIHNPPVLFLDEPTLGVDVMSAREIREMVKEMVREGRTVVLSSHNLWEVQNLCSELSIINKGKIIYSGSIENLEGLSKSKELEELFVRLIRGEVA